MTKKKELIIKPFGDKCITYPLGVCFVFIFLASIICLISLFPGQQDTPLLWIWVGCVCLCFLAYLISFWAYLLSPYRLYITENNVILKRQKKICLLLKRENILEIRYQKGKSYLKPFEFLANINGDTCSDLISFRYLKDELNTLPVTLGGIGRFSTLTEQEEKEGIKEYLEGVSYKYVPIISQILDLEIKENK